MGRRAGPSWATFAVAGAVIAAGVLVYLAFAKDAPDPAQASKASSDAGALLEQVGALGPLHLLPAGGTDPRVELTFALNPDLMPDDLGSMSLTSPYIIGQMKTGSTRELVDGDLYRVHVHHHILPAVAWFQGVAAQRHRVWLGALMQWELDVTQREILALYPDASVPEGGIPQPPALKITGSVVSYPSAVNLAPALATPAARKFLCMGEDACDDAFLAKVLVILVE